MQGHSRMSQASAHMGGLDASAPAAAANSRNTTPRTTAAAGRFALVNGDILRVRLGELMGRLADGSAWGEGGPGPLPEGGRCKIVTNLPYNITTDFLRAALPLGACVSELYVMVQHEAAVRSVACAYPPPLPQLHPCAPARPNQCSLSSAPGPHGCWGVLPGLLCSGDW